MSSAFVTRPAPEFKATTVFPGGEFKDISLSDFLGQWYVKHFPASIGCLLLSSVLFYVYVYAGRSFRSCAHLCGRLLLTYFEGSCFCFTL